MEKKTSLLLLLFLLFYEFNLIKSAWNWHLFKQIAKRNKIKMSLINLWEWVEYTLIQVNWEHICVVYLFCFSSSKRILVSNGWMILINLNMMHCITNVNLNAFTFRNVFCFANVFSYCLLDPMTKCSKRKKTPTIERINVYDDNVYGLSGLASR